MSGTTECMKCREIFTDMANFNKHPCVLAENKKDDLKKDDFTKEY
ncbi:hypothetical protein [Candidatus Nitrosopumilus sediminis]|nr:hypothetical protein [Candidatus Nitrosopumilus sediminis]